MALRLVRSERLGIQQLRGLSSGAWKSFIGSEAVQNMAKSLDRVGLMHLPVVREDGLIVDGRIRIAAMYTKGKLTYECYIARGSDLEVEHYRAETELAGRYMRRGERRKLMFHQRRVEKKITREKHGRDERFIQRPWAALVKGKWPTRNLPAVGAKKDGAPPPDPIDTFGLDIGKDRTNAWFEELRAMQRNLGTVEGMMKRAHAAGMHMTSLISQRILLAGIERVQEVLHDAQPVSLCPGCKGIEKLTTKCLRCGGAGYSTSMQIETVPKELLSREVLMVESGGELVPYEDFAPKGSDDD